MAASLGAETVLLTSLPAGYPAGALAGIEVLALPADDAPRYVNTYDSSGNRTQLLLSEGAPIGASSFAAIPAPGILLLAPAYHEFEGMPPSAARVCAVSLQGVLRSRDGDTVSPRTGAWHACAPFVAPGTLCFFSDEDTSQPRQLGLEIANAGGVALLTRGHSGASLFDGHGETVGAAFPAKPVEPTGAGDAFAVAFTVRFAETGDGPTALTFALMAGALAVEGAGLSGLPSRAQIEERLARVAA